jgi:chromosome segregation ATPase
VGFFLTGVVAVFKLPQLAMWFMSQSRLIRRANRFQQALSDSKSSEAQLRGDSETLRATADSLRSAFALVRTEQDAQKIEVAQLRTEFSALKTKYQSLITFAKACVALLTQHDIAIPDMPADVRDTLR